MGKFHSYNQCSVCIITILSWVALEVILGSVFKQKLLFLKSHEISLFPKWTEISQKLSLAFQDLKMIHKWSMTSLFCFQLCAWNKHISDVCSAEKYGCILFYCYGNVFLDEKIIIWKITYSLISFHLNGPLCGMHEEINQKQIGFERFLGCSLAKERYIRNIVAPNLNWCQKRNYKVQLTFRFIS